MSVIATILAPSGGSPELSEQLSSRLVLLAIELGFFVITNPRTWRFGES